VKKPIDPKSFLNAKKEWGKGKKVAAGIVIFMALVAALINKFGG